LAAPAFPNSLWDFGASLFAGRAGLLVHVSLACAAFALLAAVLRRTATPAGRAWGQVAGSVLALALLATPALAAIEVVWALALWLLVERAPAGRLRAVAVVGTIALQALAPIVLLPRFAWYGPGVRELATFATNMTQLRAWAYAYDRLRRRDEAGARLVDFALYTFFLPAFVAGPIASPRRFLEGRIASYWSAAATPRGAEVRRALARVALGAVAAAAVLATSSALGADAYARAAAGGPLGAWAHALGVYFAFYLGFTAWSESMLGFAALAGVSLPENFAYPHRAYGSADFWRRWNVTLGRWLHDYVYVPLGGAHPDGRRDRVAWWNIAAVFAVAALYHHLGGLKLLGPALLRFPTFYLGWTLWGTANAIATTATLHVRPPGTWRARDVAAVVATVLFQAACFQTALAPATLPWRDLLRLQAHLVGAP
jgi:hypothetical protein